MVASILIAIASSLKLPLSTTYVSFMVAMGASLADRAWGAESAIYRVAGVMNVIGGWFLTALSALLVSGGMAFVFYRWGVPAITTLFGLAALLFIRSQLRFMRRKKQA
jgi:phosphate/sulfate permease